MTNHRPIAYAYEAAHHCPDCTERRFGRDKNGDIPEDASDSDSNPVHAVFSWDEWWNTDTDECEVLSCDDCGTEMDCAHTAECQDDYSVECINARPRCQVQIPVDLTTVTTCDFRFDEMGDCPIHGKVQTTIF